MDWIPQVRNSGKKTEMKRAEPKGVLGWGHERKQGEMPGSAGDTHTPRALKSASPGDEVLP